MINLADMIFAKCNTADAIVRQFDNSTLRFSKAELKDLAAHRGLDTSGTRSVLAYRIARAAVA